MSAENPLARKSTGVGPRIREVINLMVDTGMDCADAANRVGMSPYIARKELARPHVLAFLKRSRQETLARICAKNPARLDALADQRDNINAAVRAVMALEDMNMQANAPGVRQQLPGVVIQINNSGVSPTTIVDSGRTTKSIDAFKDQLGSASDDILVPDEQDADTAGHDS